MDIVDIVQIKFAARVELVARTRIHVVAKWDRDQFYREVYCIETLLHITCQIISESKHPRYCFPRFVSIWPAPEIVDGIFEVCPAATKFCPLVNKLVALGFSFWWQLFDISKQFCPLVRLGPFMKWFYSSTYKFKPPMVWNLIAGRHGIVNNWRRKNKSEQVVSENMWSATLRDI